MALIAPGDATLHLGLYCLIGNRYGQHEGIPLQSLHSSLYHQLIHCAITKYDPPASMARSYVIGRHNTTHVTAQTQDSASCPPTKLDPYATLHGLYNEYSEISKPLPKLDSKCAL